MSGQLIGGVVGAAIGFFAGGNVSAGWAIGSAIGGVIDPTKVDGPRLSDLKVQSSAYGVAVPILYGGVAVAGNIIWATDLVQHAHEEGGKGGPVTNVATYTVSFALLIGEGVIEGIRRIWFDAKCVYDISDTASGDSLAASAILAQYFKLYQGTEDQETDPTMEAALGVGNVPAYLGSAYIVFTDLPLTDYGNRIPNIRVETSFEAVPVAPPTEITYEPLRVYDWAIDGGGRPYHSYGQTDYVAGYSNPIPEHFTNYGAAVARDAEIDHPGTGFNATTRNARTFIGFATGTQHLFNAFAGGADLSDDPRYVYMGHALRAPDQLLPAGSGLYPDNSFYCGVMHIQGIGPGPTLYWAREAADSFVLGSNYLALLQSDDKPPNADFQSVQVCVNYPANPPPYAMGTGILKLQTERLPTIPPSRSGCQPGDPCTNGIAQVPGHPDFCISCDGTVTPNVTISYERITGTFRQLCGIEYRSAGQGLGETLYQNALGPVLLPDDPRYGDFDFWADERAKAIANGTLKADVASPVYVTEAAKGTVSSVQVANAEEGGTTLDLIVADLCRRAGMDDGEIDVTALVDVPVMGYSIGKQMPARQAIVPLQQVYWWDFVESGRVIKAVMRGGLSAASIGLDDLGASDSMEAVVPIVPNRGQESELPATVNVVYPVRASGYENGSQYARRVTTGSKQTLSLEMPVVMTDQRAAEVADVIMYADWTNRTDRPFQTTRKYAHLEPTDIVTLSDGEFDYRVRITDRSEEGGIIKWQSVDEKPAAYSPVVQPANGAGGSNVGVRFDGPTKLELLDLPLLQDTDEASGVYAAASGYRDTWRGGAVYKSTDGGTTYSLVRNVTRQGVIGYATTVLGDFAGGNMVDEVNSVTVRMHAGMLSGITREQLLNNGNAAALGDEVIQFLRAELVSTGVYRLSGLLRGRLGTEQYLTTHMATDRFVLLTPETLYRFPMGLEEINMPEKWKAPSFGGTVEDALAIDFTDTGASLKPLSPVHLVALPSPIVSGQYNVRWVRRTRIGGAWRDAVDVPLGETSERYAVSVNEAAPTYVTSPAASVAAVPGDTISVRQVSSLVGPGFPASVVI